MFNSWVEGYKQRLFAWNSNDKMTIPVILGLQEGNNINNDQNV